MSYQTKHTSSSVNQTKNIATYTNPIKNIGVANKIWAITNYPWLNRTPWTDESEYQVKN